MHIPQRVWTDPVEGVTAVEPPLFDDDSIATEPFVRALTIEGPTTIFDPPARVARGSRKIAAPGRAASASDLEQSYDAAMRQFF